MTIEDQAKRILYDCGLLEELSRYGTPHIIGSYRMNMMAWNDLDIDIENENMSLDKLYRLSQFVFFKMVDYLKKALIYGHTRRISS